MVQTVSNNELDERFCKMFSSIAPWKMVQSYSKNQLDKAMVETSLSIVLLAMCIDQVKFSGRLFFVKYSSANGRRL